MRSCCIAIRHVSHHKDNGSLAVVKKGELFIKSIMSIVWGTLGGQGWGCKGENVHRNWHVHTMFIQRRCKTGELFMKSIKAIVLGTLGGWGWGGPTGECS
eukprot:6428370-Amphidinium_carterae.1